MVVIVLMVMMMVVMVLVDNDMFGDGSFVSGALGNSALLLTKVNGFTEMRKNVLMMMIMTMIMMSMATMTMMITKINGFPEIR